MNPDRGYLLGELLKNVSRSFYLTLRVLPADLRQPIGLAYLLARAADTIADTEAVPPSQRLAFLLNFRAQINDGVNAAALDEIRLALTEKQTHRHERILLESLQPALGLLDELSKFDLEQVRNVVTTLTQGMEFDLTTFPDESSGKIEALHTHAELDEYTYYVAGCVGDFWTRMTAAHTGAFSGRDLNDLCECGISFGKALQYTNVLRDCAKDLRIGRCYLPQELLGPAGLTPRELLNPENSVRAKPVLLQLIGVALDHFREAKRYTLTIPPSYGRLRLACLWPVLIGLETLIALAANDRWLDPACTSKITRRRVYRIMGLSLPAVGSDMLVDSWIESRIAKLERAV